MVNKKKELEKSQILTLIILNDTISLNSSPNLQKRAKKYYVPLLTRAILGK